MKNRSNVNRPLSPHLTIYKPQFTSVLSIMHRITGIGLLLSLLLVIVWFIALSMGANAFGFIGGLFHLTLVKLVFLSSIWALCYHSCAGIRHLVWDMGYGLEVKWISPSAYLVLLGSFFLSGVTIYLGWSVL